MGALELLLVLIAIFCVPVLVTKVVLNSRLGKLTTKTKTWRRGSTSWSAR